MKKIVEFINNNAVTTAFAALIISGLLMANFLSERTNKAIQKAVALYAQNKSFSVNRGRDFYYVVNPDKWKMYKVEEGYLFVNKNTGKAIMLDKNMNYSIGEVKEQ